MSEPIIRFDTKIAVILRADLAPWQELNVTAFLASGVAASAPESIGEHYADADGTKYLPLFGQPVLVFTAEGRDDLARALDKALARDLMPAVFTADMFSTGHDEANRAAVAAVTRSDLDLVGLALRGPKNAVDKITKGLPLHR
jgi:hypothetical protein